MDVRHSDAMSAAERAWQRALWTTIGTGFRQRVAQADRIATTTTTRLIHEHAKPVVMVSTTTATASAIAPIERAWVRPSVDLASPRDQKAHPRRAKTAATTTATGSPTARIARVQARPFVRVFHADRRTTLRRAEMAWTTIVTDRPTARIPNAPCSLDALCAFQRDQKAPQGHAVTVATTTATVRKTAWIPRA